MGSGVIVVDSDGNIDIRFDGFYKSFASGWSNNGFIRGVDFTEQINYREQQKIHDFCDKYAIHLDVYEFSVLDQTAKHPLARTGIVFPEYDYPKKDPRIDS